MKERKEKTFSVLDSIHRLNLSFHFIFFGGFSWNQLELNVNDNNKTKQLKTKTKTKNCKVKPDRKFKNFLKKFSE